MRRIVVFAALLGALLISCAYGEDVETQDIVATIPWSDHDEADYVLLDRDDEEELGRGTVTIDRSNGQFELQLNFANDEGSDDTSVLVDAETLKPDFVRRMSDVLDFLFEGTYNDDDPAEEGELDIRTVEEGEERTSVLRLDEEHYYDNESSIFIWRTIAFADDYEVSYNAVLVNRRDIRTLTVRVRDQQEITVPAGTFQTWHLEITGEGLRQEAWYSTDPGHVLVQYDNSQTLLRLTEYRPGP